MKIYTFWRSLATFRVRVALNIKGLTAEQITVDLLKGEQAASAFKALNPAMALPVLVEDDGTVLTQSLAIMEYLDERHPSPALLPNDPRDRARVRALAQMTIADSHPLSVPRVRARLAQQFGADDRQIAAWANHWLGAGLDAYEAALASDPRTGDYCHHDQLTIADICLASHAAGVELYGGSISGHPTVSRIVARCMADQRFAAAHPRRQPGAPSA